MTRLVVALPGAQCHLGRLQGVIGQQLADQGVQVLQGRVGVGRQLPVGGDRQFAALLALGNLAGQAPEFRRIALRGQVALGGLHPLQAFVGVALHQRQHGGGDGPGGGDLRGIAEQRAPGVQRRVGLACAFGQPGQPLQAGGAAGVLLQVAQRWLRLPQAFVGFDQILDQLFIARFAAQLVVQGFDQCRIMEQPWGQSQHGLPGVVFLGLPCDEQPLLQRLHGAFGPFGHPRQALAPDEAGGLLLHGRVGHGPCVLGLAVFEEHLIAQRKRLVIKRQGWGLGGRCALHGPRHLLHLRAQEAGTVVVLCGGGSLLRSVIPRPLPQERNAQQAAGIAVCHIGAPCGACDLDDQQQGVAVVCQRAQLALGQGQGAGRIIARAQGAQGLMEEMLGLCGAVAGVAREHEKLCAARIVACGQCIARCALVGGGVLWLLLGLGLGPLLLQALAQGVVAELGGKCDEPALAIQWPVFGCQRVQQGAQPGELLLAFVLAVFGGAHILGVAKLPQRPQSVTVDLRVVRCQCGGECHVGTVHLAVQDLLARQQQAQGGVFWVAAQQVVQVGGRQR